MAMISFLLHLLTAEYGLSAPVVSWQISLNAAVFSTVCLASRFDYHLSAFSLISFSVFCFFLFPILCHNLASPLLPSIILGFFSLLLLFTVSRPQACLAVLAFVALQLGCPVVFFKLQASKQTIHGPWDEATPFSEGVQWFIQQNYFVTINKCPISHSKLSRILKMCCMYILKECKT